MAKKKSIAKESIASQAVVTIAPEGSDKAPLVHLPDGVFDIPREDGDKAPEDYEVEVMFHTFAQVNDEKFMPGARVKIMKSLADSLHKCCEVIAPEGEE